MIVEPNAMPQTSDSIDVAALVRTVVGDFSGQAEARGIDLGADIAERADAKAVVEGDAEQLRVLLNNLVDNALRYTPAGGRVDVRLRTGPADRTLQLEVCDSGPGIPAADRQRVFDRFYRGMGAHGRAGTDTGSGLGLSIVHAIAERHGATVELGEGLPSAHGKRGLAVGITLRTTFLSQP